MKNWVRSAGWVLVCGSLVACGGDAPDPTPAATADSSARQNAPESAEFVAAVPVGEPLAFLTASFRVLARPQVGEEAAVVLALVSTEPLDSLQVNVRSPQLAVQAESGALAVVPVEADRRYELPFAVRASEPGLADLAVEVRTVAGESVRTAQFAIPVLTQAPAGGG